jgi:tRNA modification GTPase
LQGEFSAKINALVDQLIWLRTYIEAGIDFVDEEIDLLADGQVIEKLNIFMNDLDKTLDQAQQGYLLKECELCSSANRMWENQAYSIT